jgi:hypothetical protein
MLELNFLLLQILPQP